VSELPEILRQGEPARLIPVAPVGQRERQACSVLLAVLSVVQPFARQVFQRMGQRMGRRSWVDAYTEVIFKRELPDDSGCRPDGLVILSSPQGEWRALVEAKIGNGRINVEQICRYHRIAKDNDIDAIITISNELTPMPEHLPYDPPREMGGRIQLFHWPWATLLMMASMLSHDASDFDEEQHFILTEALRYLEHQSSDIRGFNAMAPSWPGLVQRLRAGAEIRRDEADVADALRCWHQAQANLCVILSRELGFPIGLKLSRPHRDEQRVRWNEDLIDFVKSKQLLVELDIPAGPGALDITVDVARRNVICRLTVSAPDTPKQYAGKLNWLLKQLPEESDETAVVNVVWRHGGRTSAGLRELRSNIAAARLEREGAVPRAFEVVVSCDLDRKFGVQTFPPAIEDAVLEFYETVARHIRAPRPARVVEETPVEVEVADAWMSADDPISEPKPRETGIINGRAFIIFDDGSVEIETADGLKRFDSVTELMAAAQTNRNGDGRMSSATANVST
jgi:hypothetical protein